MLTLLIRLTVGITYIYASFYKVIEPGAFAKSIWFYHMVPGNLINLIALILPWLELVVGLALIVGLFYRGAVLWINLITVLFIIALSTAIVRGLNIDCGCFKVGKEATATAWDALIFDIGLLALTLQLWFSRSRKWMLAAK